MAAPETDLYAVLGGSRESSADELKRLFRRQSLLVHPDKNKSEMAMEAFKRLSSAYDVLGDEESRQAYDQRSEADGADARLDDLLERLRERRARRKFTMLCSNESCVEGHPREPVNRPLNAARHCAAHNTYHPVREGDLWRETERALLLSRTRTFICMEGGVWDVSDWARCMGYDRSIQADAHIVPRLDLRDYHKAARNVSRMEAMFAGLLAAMARERRGAP